MRFVAVAEANREAQVGTHHWLQVLEASEAFRRRGDASEISGMAYFFERNVSVAFLWNKRRQVRGFCTFFAEIGAAKRDVSVAFCGDKCRFQAQCFGIVFAEVSADIRRGVPVSLWWK